MAVSEISPEAESEFDLLGLWRVLWDYRILIVAVATVSVVMAVILALIAPKIYRSEVVVTQVANDGMGAGNSVTNRLGGLAGLVGMNIAGGDAGREADALLRSRRQVEEFITLNNLVPELFPKAEKQPTLWLAVRRFQGSVLSIREDKRAGTTTIAMNWTDPAVAAKWANAFVRLANDRLRAKAIEESKRNIDYLNGQIEITSVVEMQRVMYNLIESETKTLMLANARFDYAFAIVDPAVAPEIRISPKRTIMVLFGGVLGLLAGTFVALVHRKFRAGRRTAAVAT